MSLAGNEGSVLMEFLRTVDTPTLSNAIESLSIRPRQEGFAPLQIRCLFPEFGRLCGYAVTAQVETFTKMEEADRRMFLQLYEAVAAAPKPAVVAFQEGGGHRDYAAHCGEVMATVFSRLGAIGLVTDSGVRDLPEVRAMHFHYFARGAVASHSNFRIVRVGVPIQIDGMVIRPGDLLHGDENGLLSVPEAPFAALSKAVDGVRARERKLMEFVRGDQFTMEGLKKHILE